MAGERWEPRPSDIEEMQRNLTAMQYRGVVDYTAAERLRHVLETYEEITATFEKLDEVVRDLRSAVEDLEFDASEYRVAVGGDLDDLGLDEKTREAIDKALDRENDRQSKRLDAEWKAAVESMTKEIDTLALVVE